MEDITNPDEYTPKTRGMSLIEDKPQILPEQEKVSVIHQQYNFQQNIQQTVQNSISHMEHLQKMERFEKIKITLLAVILGVAVSLLITAFFMYQKLKDIERILQNAEIYSEEIYKSTDELLFVLDLKEDVGISYFNGPVLEKVYAQQQNLYTEGDFSISAAIVDPDTNAEYPVELSIQKESNTRYTISSTNAAATLKPGNYQLQLNLEKGRAQATKTQDFSWGVLVINPNKAVYHPEETANLAMAVLDEEGNMVCDAYVELNITNPDLETTTLTTDDGTIKVNDGCHQKAMILEPDFDADYEVGGAGRYNIELTAVTDNGSYTIYDSFEVKEYVPYELERITATRIYPPETYPVTIKVRANEDYTGEVTEMVHWEFNIPEDPDSDYIAEQLNEDGSGPGTHQITWDVDWQSGHEYTLSYQYKAINRSPDFYILGPLTIGDYKEGRQWQIAADAAPGGEWWDTNYRYRQNITLSTTSDAIASTHTVRFDMSTDTLVTNNKMESDCDDLAVAYWNGSSWTQLDRTIFRCDEPDTAIWFNVESAVSADSTDDNYYVYYGYSSASPAEDHSNVWRFYDDFSDGDTTGWGNSSGSYGIDNVSNPWSGANYVMSVANSSCGGAHVKATGLSIQNVQFKALWLDNPGSTCGGGSPDADGVVGIHGSNSTTYDGALIEWDTDTGFHYDIGASGTCSPPTCPYRTFDQWDWSENRGVGTTASNYHGKYWGIDEAEPYTYQLTPSSVSATSSGQNFLRTASGWARVAVVMAGDAVANEPTSSLGGEEILVIVSGTAYSDDDEASTLNNLTEICVAKQGTDDSECVDTDGSGDFAINAVNLLSGTEVAVFINHASTHGNILSVADGNDITSLKLYQDHVLLRYETGDSISIVDIDSYDNDQNSTDMLFDAEDASPDTLSVEDGNELFVQSGYTFSPGGNITSSHDIEIDGTWDASSGETVSLSGTYKLDGGGALDPSTSTITFNGTAGTEDVITDGVGSIYNLTVNDSGGSLTLEVEDPLDVDGDLTITGGTLDVVSGEDNQLNVGGNWTNDDIFEARNGTVVFDGASNSTLDSGCADEDTCTNEDFYNLTISKSEDAQVTLANTHLRVTNLLNIVEGWLIQSSLNIRAEGTTAIDVDDFGRWSNTSTGNITLGGDVINDGNITLNANGASCGDSDSITIASTDASQRSWSGPGGFRITDVSVSYQTGSAVIYAASSTSGSSMGSNWHFIECNEFLFEGIDVEDLEID